MADGITFDKTSYKPGDKATVTVVLAGRKQTDEFKFSTAVGDLTTTTTVQADGSLTHSLPGAVTKVSDDGITAVYTVQY